MKLKTLLSIGLLTPLCLHAQLFSPVAVSGFNADMIVGTGETTGANQNATTQTLDGNNVGDTFYSLGYNTAAPTTGLPTNITVPAAQGSGAFMLQASVGNNALYNTGSLTLTTPARFTSLAVLGASGNSSSATTLTITVSYANGSTQTFGPGLFAVQDWFNNTNGLVYTTNGRVNVGTGSLDNVNSGNPRVYDSILTLNNTTSNVTSIFVSAAGVPNAAIFAVSGVAVPEPSTYVLLGTAALGGLMFFRRRSVA